jgi:predicted homoserine dehydrogenase-like protein
VEETDDPVRAGKAVGSGKTVSTSDWKLAVGLEAVQVVIDATGSPALGAAITMECLERKKHIVMMNVECDITIGPLLRRKAEQAGVIYTLAAGDEPAAIVELYRFADALGLEVVCAGKGKNNPLDIYATPDQWEERARQRKMNAKMLVEFVDGTKTMIEMAAVSNATGLVPDIRGMRGAKATRDTIQNVFCPRSSGGVLDRSGVVDFAIGVHPGVFITFTTKNGRLRESLIQRDMGNGPYYQLFRPYHLCSMEVPLTAAQTVIYGESGGHPGLKLVSECITVAKKDLKSGTKLDGIGEYCYRASIDTYETAKTEGLLPVGLAKSAVLKRDIPRDAAIRWGDVEIPGDSLLLKLRQEQDSMT